MEKEVDLQELMSIILRKWWLVAVLAVVFGTSLFLYSRYIIPEQFTSYGSLYVNNKAQHVIASYTDNNTANLYDMTTSEKLVDTYKAILSSNNFFSFLKEKTGTKYDVSSLKKMVSYSSGEEVAIIDVYVTASSPKEAQKLCAAILENANYAIMDIVEVGSVKTIDDATLPTIHSYPNVKKNTLMGILIGIIVSCCIIFIMYYFNVKIKTVEDIQTRFDLTVLGTIPTIGETGNLNNGGDLGDKIQKK